MTGRLLDGIRLSLRQARARLRGTARSEKEHGAPLVVEGFDPRFPEGEAAYNGMAVAPDGMVWFAIGTKSLDAGARVFVFDPSSCAVSCVADLAEALAERGMRAIPQGKVHADLVPIGEEMIGATHIGYYDPQATVERPGTAPGYAPYPGGWIFSVRREGVLPLVQAPAGEGIITMSADTVRRRVFALTWPNGFLLDVDLDGRSLRNHGRVMGAGEAGSKRDGSWSRVCRSLAIEPATGHVFWSDDQGRIGRWNGSSIDVVASTPRSESWRKLLWHPAERVFYGVTWQSSTLFRFNPSSFTCDELGTLGPAPATLGFALTPDGRSIHALVTGRGVIRKNEVQLASSVSLVTWDLLSGSRKATGPLRLDDGRWITQAQSLVLSGDLAYSACWVEVPRADLSARASQLRRFRRGTAEFRSRGYAEEVILVRFRLPGC